VGFPCRLHTGDVYEAGSGTDFWLKSTANLKPKTRIRDLRRAGASEMAGPIEVGLDAVIDALLARAGSWPHVVGAIESGKHVSFVLADVEAELPPGSGGTVSPRIRFARTGRFVLADLDGPFPPRLRRSGHRSNDASLSRSATRLTDPSCTSR
jgi:hypothetical protein